MLDFRFLHTLRSCYPQRRIVRTGGQRWLERGMQRGQYR
jgi:hypothetical protein